MKPVGQLQYFRSNVDGRLHPCAVCATDTTGEPKSPNSVLSRFEKRLPLAFEGTTIYLADRTYTAKRVAVFAVFSHPLNSERYVAVHGGVTSDAVCWGSHLDMHLLPDYMVYSGGEALDWGFWGNDWRSQG